MADVESGQGEPRSAAATLPAHLRLSRKPAAPVGPPAHPRRPVGLFGLLRGFLQRLRGWGRGLLSYGPLIPGERVLLIRRIRNGAYCGAGAKVVLSSRESWRRVIREPLPAILEYLRPFKVTLGFMVAGAGANVVLYYLQLRYYQTDLSVVPPENHWQHILRMLFGARPPAKRRSPPHTPPMPAIAEEKASTAAVPPLPGAPAAAGEAAAGATTPTASPAAGSLFAGSPASSFVDVNSSPPRLAPPAQEGPWSVVPLGGTQTASTTEDWTEVDKSGSGSPQHGGSPRAEGAQAGGAGEGQRAEGGSR